MTMIDTLHGMYYLFESGESAWGKGEENEEGGTLNFVHMYMHAMLPSKFGIVKN